MRKSMRLFCGIVLHPVRVVAMKFYRRGENLELMYSARDLQKKKNHRRMHEMSDVTNTAYTESSLYNDLLRGAPEW